MVFSSLLFLFAFLPVVLSVYACLKSVTARNAFLLAASLFFYAWGEVGFVWVMLISIALNYVFALAIDAAQSPVARKLNLFGAVVVNLGILLTFKYAGFIVGNLNLALTMLHRHQVHIPPISLPLGISFFTFHSLSYVIDVYRKQAKAQRNPVNLALYISLFPQLVAGPIIRYHDVCDQLTERTVTINKFAEGVRRFVFGLGKKMLIANVLAVVADQIFAVSKYELGQGMAWLAVVAYTLQIYFDFSGYSDMAIGLGLMFGFRFLENFNYPYIAQSIKDFWHRWHISLSNWFRDYLYIPLGGNRHGEWHTRFNLLSVFFLCGLWHGGSWNFVLWGLWHGAFLGLERSAFGKIISSLWKPLRHAYTLLIVMLGWVLFRADNLQQAWSFYRAMFGFAHPIPSAYSVAAVLDSRTLFILLAAIVGSTPIMRDLVLAKPGDAGVTAKQPPNIGLIPVAALRVAILAAVLSLSIFEMAAGTYNPFIYFRF